MSTKLNDEQVKQISDFLEENKSDQVKEMEEIIAKVEVNPDAPLEEDDINVSINEIGKPVLTKSDEEEEDLSIYSDLFEDGVIPEVDFNKEEVTDELIVKACKEVLGCNVSDSNKLLNIIKEYRPLSEEEKENYPLYVKLPDSIKKQINAMNGNTKTYRNQIARTLIDNIIKESVIDKEFDNVKDLMGSIAKELDMSNTVEMYTKYQKGLMEDNLRAHADKVREEGDEEKAKKLNEISDAYHESYTFDKLKEEIINNGGKFKIKPIEIEKIESRVFDGFNAKYNKSDFMIPNIVEAMMIATDKLTDYEVKDIMKFFIVFCKYCRDFTPENVAQHTFMYYSLMNIITLNFEDVNEDNEFAKRIRKAVSEVIDLIKERY